MNNQTNKPRPDSEAIVRGKRMALAAYIDLSRKRSNLVRKGWHTPTEDRAMNVLLTRMPATAPCVGSSQREWCDFIAGVTKTLGALNAIPTR